MYTALLATAPHPWTPVEVIAVLGVVSTAVVGLGGLALQLVLTRNASVRERKSLRYQELIAAYTEVGRYESRVLAEMYGLFKYNADRNSPLMPARSLAKTMKEVGAVLEKYDARHSRRMLDLHDASPEVRARLKTFQTRMETLVIPENATFGWFDDLMNELEDELKQFYIAAGIDARASRIPEN